MPTVTLTGQSAVAYAGNLRISSSDWHEFFYDQQLIVDSSATALKSLEGQSSESTIGEISESGFAITETNGIEATASLGTAIFSGTENVSVIISGEEMTAYAANISAGIENPVTWSGGKPMRYQANHIKNGKAILQPISAFLANSELTASGTTVINATISLNNVVSFTQASDINASGTLEISDEELILLLAA